jgi:hypothetical protein
MMGGDMGRMTQMMEAMHCRMATGAPRALQGLQRIEGQLAYYRTELGIAAAQEPQWNAFAAAVRAAAGTLRQAYGQAV